MNTFFSFYISDIHIFAGYIEVFTARQLNEGAVWQKTLNLQIEASNFMIAPEEYGEIRSMYGRTAKFSLCFPADPSHKGVLDWKASVQLGKPSKRLLRLMGSPVVAMDAAMCCCLSSLIGCKNTGNIEILH